ncbi:60S ribosomal protein L31 [Candidatus Woesearchaeota archaeon]|nr:60S ribosomal protein L31 [Candidatus Woesearchaeota archaeon]
MATLERNYNVPLRKAFRRAPKYKRTKRAINALKKFIKRHMKSDNIRIGRHLNQEMWKNGIKNPPHHIKVNLVKEEDNLVKAELFGFKYEELTKEDIEKINKGKKPEKKEAGEEKGEEITELEKELEKVTEETKAPEKEQKEPETKSEKTEKKPAAEKKEVKAGKKKAAKKKKTAGKASDSKKSKS